MGGIYPSTHTFIRPNCAGFTYGNQARSFSPASYIFAGHTMCCSVPGIWAGPFSPPKSPSSPQLSYSSLSLWCTRIMPIYNITVDDASPIFAYSANQWIDTDQSDPNWEYMYANSTFRSTPHAGAQVTFSFTGTGVYIYGAQRGNHDSYTVILDGQGTRHNGHSSLDMFKQLLFSASGLQNTQHDITITNSPSEPNSANTWFDLDFVTLTIGDDDHTTGSTNQTMDDTSRNIAYADWEVSPPTNETALGHNGTSHSTTTFGATATIPFSGNAIYVYGATRTTHGLYNVSLDGGPPETFNEEIISPQNLTIFRPGNLIYFASGLSHADHELVLTNVDTTGRTLDLDQVISTTWTNSSSTSASAGVSPSTVVPRHRDAHIAAIVGGVVGGIAALALFALGALFVLRRRRRRKTNPDDINPDDINPFPPEREPSYDLYHRSNLPAPDNRFSPFSDLTGTQDMRHSLPPPEYSQVFPIGSDRGNSPTGYLPHVSPGSSSKGSFRF